ncbi:hypothetical protein LPJ53_002012 [Coemansia erecta]|uniref:Protein DGCR14 n=1 Tax=Coemansia erecta TaxID=147472 RepID=A0A9W7Y2V2_9FUNG|nr:hypothetical protein LPJ53_002012 [Coemansia erecta]
MNPDSKRSVLSEEEYKRGLSQIISRDFFPDLRRLQAENQTLQTGSGNKNNSSSTPSALLPATPLTDTSSQSLDQYLSSHMSEDTASFRQLLDREAAKRQKKKALLMGSRKPNLLHGNELHAGLLTDGGPKPLNSSSGERIVYENTRFSDHEGVWDDVDDCESVAGSEITVDDEATPVINGYRMVRSPAAEKKSGFVIRPETPRERVARQAGGSRKKEKVEEKVPRGMLSPAAQRLLASATKGSRGRSSSPAHGASRAVGDKGSGDDMLRRAYNSPYARRPF